MSLFLWFHTVRRKGKFLDELLGGGITVTFDILLQYEIKSCQMGSDHANQIS